MGFATPSLKGRALRLLARREYARAELAARLAPHLQAGEDLEALLGELEAQGFLSDARAAESLLRRRAPRLGTQRVLQELRHKGLDAELVRAAADSLRASEFARAQAVWQRRFGTPPADAQEQARQMRFLAARGFSTEVVRQVLRAAAQNE
ncbi:recombination regulator RecX [Extensimonas sp. H3M7-6]|uniref:recombination regulator RecX n=1 Tax=Extensimonas soli TaxID=3031322 RepID=UPI0023DC830C|nr:recombination regulator RecX [Extensimonas sp. H3M7-6]MDF1482788.1 recombination regulator RecX [Extensimonas sp. H3M7-6]